MLKELNSQQSYLSEMLHLPLFMCTLQQNGPNVSQNASEEDYLVKHQTLYKVFN